MKKLIFTLITTLLVSSLFAQEDRNGYVGLSIGTSTPSGDFASTDPNSDEAGYATTGIMFDINYAYKFTKSFGFTALLRAQFNGADAQALANQLANEFPTYSWTTVTDPYSIGGLMGGVYLSAPLGSSGKLYLEPRLMIGVLSANSPNIMVRGNDGVDPIWIKIEKSNTKAFSYLFGAGLRYNAGGKIALLLNLDYLGSNPKFENVVTIDSSGDITKDNYSQQFSTYNFSLGIAYRLK